MKIASNITTPSHQQHHHHHHLNHPQHHHQINATTPIAAAHNSATPTRSPNAASTLFSEQVGHVIELFQDWNDCERSVSLFAVLKRIPFSCTKFLQSVVAANLQQAYGCEQSRQLDGNANSAAFMRALLEAYRGLDGGMGGGGRGGVGGSSGSTMSSASSRNSKQSGQKESLFGGGGCAESEDAQQQRRRGSIAGSSGAAAVTRAKEELLNEILTLMPVLTPGNEDAKAVYLELIPVTVEDAVHGAVNTSLVQQIFSYVLIHPAFSTEDRRSLSKVLHHLEEHIVHTDPNFQLFPSSPASHTPSAGGGANRLIDPMKTPSVASLQNSAALSSSSAPHIPATGGGQSWQAIAPPSSAGGISTSGSSSSAASKSSEMLHLASWDCSLRSAKPRSSISTICNGSAAISKPTSINIKAAVASASGAAIGDPLTPVGSSGSAASSSASDDHHISFSKNGTEIIDFDTDDTDKSNTQIGYDTLASLTDFLAVPALGTPVGGGIGDGCVAMKTRRSNSLTTAAAAGCGRLGSIGGMGFGVGGAVVSNSGGVIGHHQGGFGLGGLGLGMSNHTGGCLTPNGANSNSSCGSHSGSAQNLLQLQQQMLQKPRSFSLSMASGGGGGGGGDFRGPGLLSCGSDTRLDDFRSVMQQQQQHQTNGDGSFGMGYNAIGTPTTAAMQSFAALVATPTPIGQQPQQQHKVGMSGIGQWLKSLRLHKYVWLFSKISYEEMLSISEEYLQQLNVTKGARHKLVVCIQRLKDRHALLVQLEQDLVVGGGRGQLVAVLEELTGVVLTPMRPVEMFNEGDVGGQFLRVLNLVSNMVCSMQVSIVDEEPINTLLWILEKAVHNEAFVAHTNQLKEQRYKVARIKAQFPPKPLHFVSPGSVNAMATPTTTTTTTSVGLVPTPTNVPMASMTPNAQSNNNVTLAPPPSASANDGANMGPNQLTRASQMRRSGWTRVESNEVVVGHKLAQRRIRTPATLPSAGSKGFGFETQQTATAYPDLTPTSSTAPWHNYWAPSTGATTAADDNGSTNSGSTSNYQHNQQLQQQQQNATRDSDYYSMTSSQSNSTESLDQILSNNRIWTPASFAERFGFDRAISKPTPSPTASSSFFKQPAAASPSSASFVGGANDFLSTPLAQLAAFASPAIAGSDSTSSSSSARRYSMSATLEKTTATAAQPTALLQLDAKSSATRRDSFGGVTEGSATKQQPIMGTRMLLGGQQPMNMHSDYKTTPTTSQISSLAGDGGDVGPQRTILRRQLPSMLAAESVKMASQMAASSSVQMPNIRVPPPNYKTTTTAAPPTNIPVFDSTRPPPAFVRRPPPSPQIQSPKIVEPKSAAAAAAAIPTPKVELYRPRELRQTPQQCIQPPSSSSSAARQQLQAGARAFVPASARTLSAQQPPVSKIAAKFTEAPLVHVSAPTPPQQPLQKPRPPQPAATITRMHEFPALGASTQNSTAAKSAASPAHRYIVKQSPAPTTTATATTPLTTNLAVGLYQTPVSSAPAVGQQQQSLASIVRTTLPKLMAQHPSPKPAAATTTSTTTTMTKITTPRSQAAADDGLGMANINNWLKSLRLHKYQWLFAPLTYAQMLAIDDAHLERMQITKGARNKLALSVQKLRERYAAMERLEAELLGNCVAVGGAGMAEVIDELTQVAQTPMRPAEPFEQRDVATKLMKLLNMVYDILSRGCADPDCLGKMGWLLDVALHSEGCASFKPQLRRMQQRLVGHKNHPY